jgi:septum formation protein
MAGLFLRRPERTNWHYANFIKSNLLPLTSKKDAPASFFFRAGMNFPSHFVQNNSIVSSCLFWYDEIVSPGERNLDMPRLVLASSSPRRKELLEKLHIPFAIRSPRTDETVPGNMPPAEVVLELAVRKAKAVAANCQNSCVIGADTIVAIDGEILGKPSGREQAGKMLKALSGRTHSVFTGVAVLYGQSIEAFYEKTDVTFWELSEEEIGRYIDTGEPFDKAGAYGIQEWGSLLVKEIHGDYFSVVGLPLARLARALEKIGFPLFQQYE